MHGLFCLQSNKLVLHVCNMTLNDAPWWDQETDLGIQFKRHFSISKFNRQSIKNVKNRYILFI